MLAARQTDPVVHLEGDGIASVCLARLLTDASVCCELRANSRPKLAAILLGEQTQHLLREIFPNSSGEPDLFDGFAEITHRIVLWGDAPAPLMLPHRGVVAPEAELLARLWRRVPALVTADGRAEPVLQVQTTRLHLTPDQETVVGERYARFAAVTLFEDAEHNACWVESVEQGWLFLLDLGDRRATLIAVGDSIEQLLSSSRLVALKIAKTEEAGPPVSAMPRLTDALTSAIGLSCGSAAMSFDPLCGEGAGNAVREAFLAAAVLRARLEGGNAEELSAHYAARLRQGFLRHLKICLQFYATGGQGPFWQQESSSLQYAIRAMEAGFKDQRPSRFRLVDRDLLPFGETPTA